MTPNPVLLRASTDRRLLAQDVRCLCRIIAEFSGRNHARLTAQFVADEVGMSRFTVSRSMARLVRYHYLERFRPSHRAYFYRLTKEAA